MRAGNIKVGGQKEVEKGQVSRKELVKSELLVVAVNCKYEGIDQRRHLLHGRRRGRSLWLYSVTEAPNKSFCPQRSHFSEQ